MITGELPRILKPTAEDRVYNNELERIKQAISNSDQMHRYDGELVAELLAHMGLIHKSPESARRWRRQ
jgi:hypothetical protein